ncbi:uncharacterized protein LOC110626011 isoform X2 [Manihot esculenta]|uniref:Uncharacterized protein n=2 Tax=Manihot esculenta TaxID=3983 RepID=A0ACB7GTW0_MANES|nr:uncharacterized protein LOC110626011 isoform X2 [Manihot esculenta]KAG8643172.1 hypothetical protein MANES_11G012900v8 [Manihot esculenta]KAG8643175.1 hypothetical protein MANES_11G012900v8 [Manihot esculenta]
MDLTSPEYFQAFASTGEPALETNTSLYGQGKDNLFADTFQDPLCKLNLKETSEFVKSFPMPHGSAECRGFLEVPTQRSREGVDSVTQRRVEAPSTPESSKMQKENGNFKHQMEVFAEKSRVTEEKVSKLVSSFQGSVALDQHNPGVTVRGFSASSDVLLKDKLIDEVEPVLPNFRYSETSKEGFLFRNSANEVMKDVGTEVIHEVKHRDIGTEMTPLGSSTTSRCHTPFKSSSPARHNTPANRSGPLPLGNSDSTNSIIDISQLQACHLAKLQFGSHYDSVASNWSSREEEEEEISKSLRHFETGITCRRSVSDSRAATWEEEEKTKCCLRYQREEAKIQAWLNLQTAKAEAQSRKLEVKVQKMRSNLEEKLMKRMAVVHRKAEEWRAAARQQRPEQTKMMINRRCSSHASCGCFPCNTYP